MPHLQHAKVTRWNLERELATLSLCHIQLYSKTAITVSFKEGEHRIIKDNKTSGLKSQTAVTDYWSSQPSTPSKLSLQHLRVSESLSEKLWWSDFKLLTVVFCTLSNSFHLLRVKLIKRSRAPLPRLSAAVLPSFFSSLEFPSFLGHYLTLINAVPQISLKRLYPCIQGSRGSLSAAPDKWHIHMQSFYSSLI